MLSRLGCAFRTHSRDYVTNCKYWWRREAQYSTSTTGMKVTICGAAGRTGQPLGLLLKQCPLLDEIALYDISATCGQGMELSHVDTKCKVSSYSGRHMLGDALVGAKVVVIVARNENDSFENSAPIITELALQICNTCPNAFVIVATEPVESMVPLLSEVQRLRGVYHPRKLLGCVELNCVRANTVLADFLKVPPETIRVPVIGGATAKTMVPVLSSAVHPCKLTQDEVESLTSSIMSGNEAIVNAKCYETATPNLAGAYAIARTTINVVKGLQGSKVVQCGYVDCQSQCAPDCQFFANDVSLGTSGIEKNLGVPELTKFENCLLLNCLHFVRNEISRAIWLVYTICQKTCGPCCPTPPVAVCEDYACAPPVNWTCDCPDACRDEYLATICREMTCTPGSQELVWLPRKEDYDAKRVPNVTHQIIPRGKGCPNRGLPRSIMYGQMLRDRRDPCPKSY